MVDRFLFVFPRLIPLRLPAGASIRNHTRPLRADTRQGMFSALASSEGCPHGTTMQFEVTEEIDGLHEHVLKCLDFGAKFGMGQWRTSGAGRFTWKELKSA